MKFRMGYRKYRFGLSVLVCLLFLAAQTLTFHSEASKDFGEAEPGGVVNLPLRDAGIYGFGGNGGGNPAPSLEWGDIDWSKIDGGCILVKEIAINDFLSAAHYETISFEQAVQAVADAGGTVKKNGNGTVRISLPDTPEAMEKYFAANKKLVGEKNPLPGDGGGTGGGGGGSEGGGGGGGGGTGGSVTYDYDILEVGELGDPCKTIRDALAANQSSNPNSATQVFVNFGGSGANGFGHMVQVISVGPSDPGKPCTISIRQVDDGPSGGNPGGIEPDEGGEGGVLTDVQDGGILSGPISTITIVHISKP